MLGIGVPLSVPSELPKTAPFELAGGFGLKVPVGCVIVHEGRIIARAHNLREATQDPTTHAEMLAQTTAEIKCRSR